MAVFHNQVAYHGDVPAKNWKAAESHYRKAMELFDRAEQPIEAVNSELNIQSLYHLSGKAVDLDRVSEITRLLEEAGDQRKEKGKNCFRKFIPEYVQLFNYSLGDVQGYLNRQGSVCRTLNSKVCRCNDTVCSPITFTRSREFTLLAGDPV